MPETDRPAKGQLFHGQQLQTGAVARRSVNSPDMNSAAGLFLQTYKEEVGLGLAVLLDAEEAHVSIPHGRLAICRLHCDTKQLPCHLHTMQVSSIRLENDRNYGGNMVMG